MSKDFRIDIVLNFMGRFSEDQIFHIRDLLNEGKSQRFIADHLVDRDGKNIHPSQLSRFVANTYERTYIIKPEIVGILQHIHEIRNARIEENAKAREAVILSLTRPDHKPSSETT